MDETKLLERVTFNPEIFGGKPTIRGRRLGVEQLVLVLLVPMNPPRRQQ